MSQVTLENVSLTLGGNCILRDVNLQIDSGEFCVFVGPSGCGKSSLLRLIAGLEDITEGDIRIDGESVLPVPPAQRNIAMVFQGYALYPHMTVYDNIAFALRRAKLTRTEIDARVQGAARILQLEELLHRRPKSLSGGQRQRVAIGRAIVKKPKAFLFDEPLSNLDAALRVQTRVEILRLHHQLNSASMLYVTHDQVEAMTLANKIVLLRPQTRDAALPSIAQVGRPMDLYHHPDNIFTAKFIGTPAMNLLPATLSAADDQGIEATVCGATCAADVVPEGVAVGEAVTLGVRPEHVIVGAGPLRAGVTHIESLGEHIHLYLRLPQSDMPLVLAKTVDENIAVGDEVPVWFPREQMHVFRADGQALRRVRS
jgi:multiple sugar transport system ATP-binding protein